MFYNKKSYFSVFMMLIVSGILLFALVAPCAAQVDYKEGKNTWWQNEIPPAGPGQMINPAYVSKRDELRQSWSQLHRQNSSTRQYRRWTNGSSYTHTKRRNDDRARAETNRLKQELKKIPMYIAESAEPDPGPAPPPGEMIIKY